MLLLLLLLLLGPPLLLGPLLSSPLTTAMLAAQSAPHDPPQQYAVLRCVEFRPDAVHEMMEGSELELFSVNSTDESNVALFHPHADACAFLG